MAFFSVLQKRFQKLKEYSTKELVVDILQLVDDINTVLAASGTAIQTSISNAITTAVTTANTYTDAAVLALNIALSATITALTTRVTTLEYPGIISKNALYALTATDNGRLILADTTAGAFSVTADPAALGAGFRFGVKRRDAGFTNFCTAVACDSGADYLVCLPNHTAWFESDGTNFHVTHEAEITLVGSNANGNYRYESNGTLTCWLKGFSATTVPDSWTFPAVFIAAPTCAPPDSENTISRTTAARSASTTTVQIRVWDTTSTLAVGTVNLTAIGRWRA